MKIALVHDDLVQWGGAEKMLVSLSKIFTEAPIFTSVYDSNNLLIRENFKDKTIITSFLQKLPGWREFYKALLPLYPIAFESFDFSGFDVVISQTTRFAKSIITKPSTRHICFCHTPPRFLWRFTQADESISFPQVLSLLRLYDRYSSTRVDEWIAGSLNAKLRIRSTYKVEAKVIYPFVDLQNAQSVPKFNGGYLLIISRFVSYKNIDLAIRSCQKLNLPLKIVGSGPKAEELKCSALAGVEFLGNVNKDLLYWLLAGCKALLICGEEDFGLTSLEAQVFRKPVVALARGGALETVVDGQTGIFFETPTVDSLVQALTKLKDWHYNEKAFQDQVEKFSKQVFTKAWLNVVKNDE